MVSCLPLCLSSFSLPMPSSHSLHLQISASTLPYHFSGFCLRNVVICYTCDSLHMSTFLMCPSLVFLYHTSALSSRVFLYPFPGLRTIQTYVCNCCHDYGLHILSLSLIRIFTRQVTPDTSTYLAQVLYLADVTLTLSLTLVSEPTR